MNNYLLILKYFFAKGKYEYFGENNWVLTQTLRKVSENRKILCLIGKISNFFGKNVFHNIYCISKEFLLEKLGKSTNLKLLKTFYLISCFSVLKQRER